MEVDRYGILKLYPTKIGGRQWFNKWNNGQSRTLQEGDKDPYDSKFFLLCGQPNVPLLIDGRGRATVKAYTSSARLFVEGPWLNTEMTVYAKGVQRLDDVQLRSRSNHETPCSFGNYLAHWHRITKESSIEVESMHPIYKRHLGEKIFAGFPLNRYVGFKQITRTIDGNKVKVEGYMNDSDNDSMNQTKWVKQTEFIFDGSITIPVVKNEPLRLSCVGKGDGIANTNPMKTLYLNQGKWCWIRANNVDQAIFKYFSIREIGSIAYSGSRLQMLASAITSGIFFGDGRGF